MEQGKAVSTGYKVLNGDVERGHNLSTDAWSFPDVAAAQEAAYSQLLAEMRLGRPRLDFQVAAQAVKSTGIINPTLLEVGCGSGYYAEVMARLVGPTVQYEGADLSPAMIELARISQPGTRFHIADACALPFEDNRFDVVMNGVALMHIPDWKLALAEARRVTAKFVILHTVPILEERPTTLMTKNAYGRPVLEVIINRHELYKELTDTGLRVIQSWESIPYDLSGLLGERTNTITILARKELRAWAGE